MQPEPKIREFQGIRPTLGQNVYIDPQSAVIGDVSLADDVSVWPFVSIRGDVNRIEVGARSNIQDNSVLHVTHDGPYTPGGVPLILGEDVTVGHMVMLHACEIGSRVLIGMGSIVMDKVKIADDVLLAAGSLVPPGKQLESGYLYAGRPARQVRELKTQELENLKYSAEHYVRVKNKYLNAG